MTSNDDTASTIVHSTSQFESFFYASNLPLDCMLIVIMNIFLSITSQFNFYHMIKVGWIKAEHAWLVCVQCRLDGSIRIESWVCIIALSTQLCLFSYSASSTFILSKSHYTTYRRYLRTVKINLHCMHWVSGEANASEWADGLYLDTNLKSIHRTNIELWKWN